MLISLEDSRSSRLYFEAFRDELRPHKIEVVIVDHQGSDPKSVVEAAKVAGKERRDPFTRGLSPFDEVWVVFDTEGPQNADRDRAARNAIEQARQLNFKTAISNPAFEYWLLLHFEKNASPFHDAKSVIHQLKKHIRGYTKNVDSYGKTRPLVSTAVKHSKELFEERCADKPHPCDCHPCTEVYRVIESLLDQIPPGEREV